MTVYLKRQGIVCFHGSRKRRRYSVEETGFFLNTGEPVTARCYVSGCQFVSLFVWWRGILFGVFFLLGTTYPIVAVSQKSVERLEWDSVSNESTSIETESAESLVEQLADDSYFLRQRAHRELEKRGIEVFLELSAGVESNDLEIAERCRQLLSGLKNIWTSDESDSRVRSIMTSFERGTFETKLECVQRLSDVALFERGEGIKALCRIVRYELSPPIRLAAAKEIVAIPPFSPYWEQQWFDKAQQLLGNTVRKKDVLLSWVADYLQLRRTVAIYRKSLAQQTPDELQKSPEVLQELREKVTRFAETLQELRQNTEMSGNIPDTDTDIVLHYAVAALQQDLGMTAEMETTCQLALAVAMQGAADTPVQPQGIRIRRNFTNRSTGIMAHFEAAQYLGMRQQQNWAEREYTLIAETGGLLRWDARLLLAELAFENDDVPAAVTLLQEVLAALEEKNRQNVDMGQRMAPDFFDFLSYSTANLRARLFYFQAVDAGNRADWMAAKQRIAESLALDDEAVDGLIFRYQMPETTDSYKKETQEMARSATKNTQNVVLLVLQTQEDDDNDDVFRELAFAGMNPQNFPQGMLDPQTPMPMISTQWSAATLCNQLAWLLGNTDGDLDLALRCSQKSLSFVPDYPPYLDTLAHVHFARKEWNEAITIQQKAVELAPEFVLFRKSLDKFKRYKP